MTKFYRCIKCGTKVIESYLAKHWLNKHFSLMYIIIEVESQTIFELNTETGETKKVDVKLRQESF